MAYPDLGNWNGRKPNEAEDDAADIAEALAWAAIDRLTAGRVAFETTTIRPENLMADGSVYLPPPVGGVTEVRSDGVVVPADQWRVDQNLLIYFNTQTWPSAQDLTLDSGVGVFEVDYYNGWRPGALLIWAAGELANEFYLAAAGKKCRLPKNVTAITRQGVSFEMSAPLFDAGRTGIHEVDVVLARYNPQGVSAQTIIATPETLALSRRIGY